MKIGILTYHRTLNYGGCLQALATRIVLEQMGHSVYYVDYWPKYHSDVYSEFSFDKVKRIRGLKNKIRLVLDEIKYGPYRKKRRDNFMNFINNEIIPFCRPFDENYDIVLYGSDQIWRKQPVLNDYNPVYFADNSIKASKHIAFSASMGNLPTSEDDKQEIKKLVSHFDDISVREQALQELLLSLGLKDVNLTLDPTLLLSRDQWNYLMGSINSNTSRYVLLYALHDYFDKEKIKDFASARGLKVKTIYGIANSDDSDTVITTAGPRDFISLIQNADYVFTSSFHGLAFSLVFEKEFFVSFGDNAERAKSLLDSVGLMNRFLLPKASIPEKLETINYKIVKERLQILKDHSFAYLKDVIK
jgi:hypothetical protein